MAEARVHPIDCEGGWIPCWAFCNDGFIDEHDEDPINCDPGDVRPCSECDGKGGWPCPVCKEEG